MVGRLIHDQDVGALHHQLAEQHATLFATGEHLDRLLDVVLGEQQTTQYRAHRLLVFVGLFPLGHPVEHVEVGVEIVGVILGVVADLGVLGPLDGAAVRRQLAHEGLDQGRFTDTVGTQDGDLLTHFQHHAQALEQRRLTITLGHPFHFQDVAVELFVLLEADEGVLTAGDLHFLDLDLVDLLEAGGRLARLGGVGTETGDEGLQVGNLGLLLGVVGDQTLAGLGGRRHVLVVVARVDAQLAVIQIRHVGADGVQEVTVVRDDDHGAFTIVEHLLQPADGVDVQVVGRFVQQQDVGVGEQRLCQQHPQFPARGHFAHGAVVQLDGDAGTQQQLAGAGFGGIAVVFCDQAFQLGGLHVVVVGGVEVGIDGIALGDGGPQLAMAHHDHVQHAHLFVGELILAQLTDALVDVQAHITASGLQIAAEDLHEGGLATAVCADEAVAVAAAKLDADVLKQRLGAELHGDVVAA